MMDTIQKKMIDTTTSPDATQKKIIDTTETIKKVKLKDIHIQKKASKALQKFVLKETKERT